MIKHLLFTRNYSPQKKINQFILQYDLKNIYKDKTESVFENDNFIVSVSKKYLYIILINSNNCLENDIKKFFYGDKYEQFKNKR